MNPGMNPTMKGNILGPKDATTEHDFNIPVGDPQPLDGGIRKRHYFIGNAIEDRTCDPVPITSRHKYQRRELHEAMRSELAEVERLSDGRRGSHSKESGHPLLEHGGIATTVLGANGVGQSHLADPSATRREVSRDFPEGRESDNRPIWTDAGGVHATAADDGDAPTPVCSGSQHRHRVVADEGPSSQVRSRQRGMNAALIDREIRTSQTEHANIRHPMVVGVHAKALDRRSDRGIEGNLGAHTIEPGM
jgi:hypothetical protein